MLLLACSIAWPQTFDVISLEGSAKVQRVQKKEWEKIAIGSQLHDNDIVESFFLTKCVMRFGKGNIVIVGSNSKVLVNIRERRTSSGSMTMDASSPRPKSTIAGWKPSGPNRMVATCR